jgi:hypothetical protein
MNQLRHKPIVTEIDFCAWLSQAEHGHTLEYHRGFLVVDVDPTISKLPTLKRLELIQVASRARWAAEKRLLHRVQPPGRQPVQLSRDCASAAANAFAFIDAVGGGCMITPATSQLSHGRNNRSHQSTNLRFDRTTVGDHRDPTKKITGKNALVEMLRVCAGFCGDDGDCQRTETSFKVAERLRAARKFHRASWRSAQMQNRSMKPPGKNEALDRY